ncbi:MAG: ankyrin repeat domain-containing protein [Chlamydiales bacterium]|nr:ankyrin repeat domain-containing protein [Chlamydiia bacterium]MCP5507388.1 ankyrin repeat domain-containing protein [Chlamydiales bacterium]
MIISSTSINEAKEWLKTHQSKTAQQKIKQFAGKIEFQDEKVVKKVATLIKAGMDPNAKLSGFVYPTTLSGRFTHLPKTLPLIYRATIDGQTDLVRVLLEANADVEVEDNNGKTALFVACQRNEVDIVDLLLEHKADINHRDSEGNTPLHAACAEGNISIAQKLIKCGASPVCETTGHFQTPLLVALYKEHFKLVDQLLKLPAALEYVKNNSSILMTAVAVEKENPNAEVFEKYAIKFIDLGADPHSIINETPVFTPWLSAASTGKTLLIKHILDKYPDSLNKQAGKRERTALQMAARWGQFDTVQFLLKRGADTTIKDIHGCTAKDLAEREGNRDIARLIARIKPITK